MSNYIVSARKYRPDNFDTVVGQPSVTNTLKSAIKTGHTAHAYLFCGPRGVGKTTCARIFAKTLNCFNITESTEACDQCESCKSFNESRSFNIHELDAASNNSVDDIRSLIDKVRILPQVGRYSIYIIDEVHMLSQAAFNAFLKTLEEPPEHAIFILATTEKHKIIPTILSRCQIFDFQRIRVEDIVGYLAHVAALEKISYEEEALNVIALKADGAMRDALSIFDQVVSFTGGKITYREVLDNLNVLDYEFFFKMTGACLEHSSTKALLLFNEILQRGFDGQNFLAGLSSHLRDILVSHDEATLPLLEVSEVLKSRYRQQATICSEEFLFAALEVCNQCEISFKTSRNQRLHVELALIRLCNIDHEKKNLIRERFPVEMPEITGKSRESSKPVENREKTVEPENKPAEPVQVRPSRLQNASSAVSESNHAYEIIPRISIKDALNAANREVSSSNDDEPKDEIEEIEEIQAGAGEKKPISEEFLDICWDSYSGQIREEKPRMAVTLKSIRPKITDESTIVVELNNRSQLDDFLSNTKNDLEKFLRREMHHGDLCIQASLIETPDSQQAKLYTSEERFRYLNQKNPVLTAFRQKLNLELE